MDSLAERLKVYADDVAHYHEEADAPLVMEAVARITELERQLKVARDALGYADSWLGRWAQHVGNCKGEFLCTCGLTRIRFDVSQALANMEQADD